MWSEPRFSTGRAPKPVLALIQERLEELLGQRNYEVWEASENLLPFFQVAGHLTRDEAIRVADRHASTWPRQPVLVLDATGEPVYSAFAPRARERAAG